MIILYFVCALPPAGAIHARTNGDTTAKEAAICISGESRQHMSKAQHDDLLDNIHYTMIEPWTSIADVFSAIKRDKTIDFDSGKSFERFKPIATLHRQSADHFTHLTYHTPCMELVLAQEKIQGCEYKWLLRLRTDVAYHSRLPSKLPAVPATRRVVFAEYCGTGEYPTDSNLKVQYGEKCHARSDNGKWGCAKDTWGLVSRAAASIYFNKTKLDSVRNMAGLCTDQTAECQLGCVLNSDNVSIYRVKLLRQILRRPVDLSYISEKVHYPRMTLTVR